jgi:hypothetical protein
VRAVIVKKKIVFVAFQSALQGGALKLAECSRLMFSIGKVLSILPVPRIMEYLNIILAPSFKEMQELLNVEPVHIIRADLNSHYFIFVSSRLL